MKKKTFFFNLKITLKTVSCGLAVFFFLWRPSFIDSEIVSGYYPAPYGGFATLTVKNSLELMKNGAQDSYTATCHTFGSQTMSSGANYQKVRLGGGFDSNSCEVNKTQSLLSIMNVIQSGSGSYNNKTGVSIYKNTTYNTISALMPKNSDGTGSNMGVVTTDQSVMSLNNQLVLQSGYATLQPGQTLYLNGFKLKHVTRDSNTGESSDYVDVCEQVSYTDSGTSACPTIHGAQSYVMGFIPSSAGADSNSVIQYITPSSGVHYQVKTKEMYQGSMLCCLLASS